MRPAHFEEVALYFTVFMAVLTHHWGYSVLPWLFGASALYKAWRVGAETWKEVKEEEAKKANEAAQRRIQEEFHRAVNQKGVK